MVEVCPQGKIVRGSLGAARLYGYSEEEMKEQSLAQVVPIYEVPMLEAAPEDLRRGKIRRSETTERMRRDGSCACVTVRRTAIRSENGKVLRMIECARALMPSDRDSPAEKQLRLLAISIEAITESHSRRWARRISFHREIIDRERGRREACARTRCVGRKL